ncbi:MAG: diacylglycerol/lipid kinase family protein [Cytophagaceae bacterium]
MHKSDNAKYLFIINPISGIGKKALLPELIRKEFDLAGKSFEIVFTEYAGHATELAKKAALEKYYAVVAVGGDGTINEIGRSLIGTDTALGIIPAGSGNGLARHLNIPMAADKAVKFLANSVPVSIDHCLINEYPYFCTAGVGFDASVGMRFAKQPKRGFTTYIKTVVAEYGSYKCSEYMLEIDGKRFSAQAFLVTFANASQYGNNAFIAPQADLQDGLIDVCILHPFPLYISPLIGYRLFSKKIASSRYLDIFKAKEVKVIRKSPGPVHFDGEPLEMGKELIIKIIPDQLKVLVRKGEASRQ